MLAVGCAGAPAARPPTALPDPPARIAPAPPPAAPAAPVARLRQDLARVFGAPIMAHALWGVDIRAVESGEVLYQLNSARLMMPASNMKIVTLAIAAEVLGWNHRFVTTLEAAGPIQNGVLAGDLFVRGGGDPTIGSRGGRAASVFGAWIEAVKAAGITAVTGRIVGDDQHFDEEGLGSGWAWDDLQAGYAAPAGALQYDENAAELVVAPGAQAGDPAIITLGAGTGLTIVNYAVTTPPGIPETISLRRRASQPILEVTGTVPLDGPAEGRPEPARRVTRQVAVVNPTVHFVRAFQDAMEAAGIRVSGGAVDFDDVAVQLAADGSRAERRVLARTESPPLHEMAGVLMKVSQNQYAETFLKAAGAVSGGLGTTAAGRRTAQATLRGWNLDPRGLVMADGSGLSRYNYLSPELLVQLLRLLYLDETHRKHFAASLPVAGREGTVSQRLRRTRAEGNAAAKTGSLSSVRALSGFVRTRDGEMLAFSVIANNFGIPAATVTWIADLAVEILANFTRHPAERAR